MTHENKPTGIIFTGDEPNKLSVRQASSKIRPPSQILKAYYVFDGKLLRGKTKCTNRANIR